MTVRLIFIRHGETASNAAGRSQGHRDEPLNERGLTQAATLAEWLAHEPVGAVYASDSIRAVDTAGPIAAAHDLGVVTDPRLREMHQGDLDGLTGEQMRTQYGDFLIHWREGDPSDVRIPGGETMRELQERMVEACETIAFAHPDSTCIVVSHNLATRALLCHALGVPLTSFRRIRHEVASMAEVRVHFEASERPGVPPSTHGWHVVRMNEQCHLAEDDTSSAYEAGRIVRS